MFMPAVIHLSSVSLFLLFYSMRTFAKEAIFHDHFEVSTAVMFLNWYSLTRFTCHSRIIGGESLRVEVSVTEG